MSDEGTCYEPGEYCRDDDHGTSGMAGDGEAITCEDNDGWRSAGLIILAGAVSAPVRGPSRA